MTLIVWLLFSGLHLHSVLRGSVVTSMKEDAKWRMFV